jgi:hypothetical protein
MVLVIPGAMYVKISKNPLSHWKNVLAIIGVVGLSSVGFTSVILTLITVVS